MALAQTFLDNHKFDPEAETRFVGALDSMQGVEGRGDVVSLASLASSRGRALVLRDAVELIEEYHSQVQPAARLIVVSGAPFVVTAGKRADVVLPLDYVMYSPDVAERTRSIASAIKEHARRTRKTD